MKNSKPKTILLVEDEESLIKIIKKKLEDDGFQVFNARSVKEALSCLKKIKKVDVVWLDHYLLGKENGLDLLVKMRKKGSSWKKIPVFLVSNTASADKVEAYMRLGISKYYVKANHGLDEIISEVKKAIF